MTRATQRAITAAVLLVLAPAAVQAFWCGEFCDYVHVGAKKNCHWPSPHICADRRHVRAPFTTMVQNGWRRQNLLGGHHFNDEATELTQAGKLKVRWIMTQAPEQYRRVFVERSLDEGVTDKRIAAAQDFATLVARGGEVPRVADTHIISEGRPASTVDFVNTQFRENMMTPALPAPTEGFEGGN